MAQRATLEQGISRLLGETAKPAATPDKPQPAAPETPESAAKADPGGKSDPAGDDTATGTTDTIEPSEGTDTPAEQAGDDGAEAEGDDAADPEATDDGTGEGEAADEGESDSSSEDDRRSAVIVHPDGKREQVTVGALKAAFLELRQSNFRQADYTRKAQALANDHRAVTNDLAAMRKRHREVIDNLDDGIIVPPAPDPRLADEDIAAFVRQDQEHRQAIERKQQIAAKRADLDREEARQKQIQANISRRQCADVLLKAIPAWNDQAAFQRDQKVMQEAAAALGFTPEEQAELVDPRWIYALHQLGQLRKAVMNGRSRLADAGKNETVAKSNGTKPVVGVPGTSGRRSGPTVAQQRLAKARANHSERRSVDSAVDLLLAIN